ncbi:MAG: rhamnulose-1-phosphate aldolase [Bacteroidetes bacterium]|nr:rhamnulose-1-phosphate aldolase [Bacteroidota bacterium]MBT5991368.1 rhamnulose-1-phosphate aldolase [Bacteroidota bacterium]
MLFGQIIESHFAEISEIAQILWDKGWAEGSAGNYSIYLGEINFDDNYLFGKGIFKKLNASYPSLANHCILLSAAGSRMRNVAKNPELYTGLLHIAEDGESATLYKHNQNPDTITPTSEMEVHLALHNKAQSTNSTMKAILHAHVTEIIAITQHAHLATAEKINSALKNIHPEFALFIPEGIAYVPFMESGNLEIAQHTLQLSENKKAIIWEKHGMITQAKDLNTAFDLMDLVAKQAGIYLKL